MSGPEQMAMDITLLENAIDASGPELILRFYEWEGLWISIGKNQKHVPNFWHHLVKQNKIKITRRPSGGNAVLHGSGLTYSLIWLSPPHKKRYTYYIVNQFLINGFSSLGLNLKFGNQLTNQIERNCFATSTNADLIDPNGYKRIGSAQYWRMGHLLQHSFHPHNGLHSRFLKWVQQLHFAFSLLPVLEWFDLLRQHRLH